MQSVSTIPQSNSTPSAARLSAALALSDSGRGAAAASLGSKDAIHPSHGDKSRARKPSKAAHYDLRSRLAMLDKASWIVHDSQLDALPIAERMRRLQRIEHCTRHLTYQATGAVLKINRIEDSSSWGNVQHCDSWACPYCGPHKAAAEGLRLKVGIAEAQRHGIYPLMITLTLRHKRGDKLLDQLQMLYDAKNLMFSGRFLAEFRDRFDLVGHNRYTEITCGSNGWHAHLHLLWFAGHELSDKGAAELQAELTPRWLKMLAKVGAEGLEGRALHVRPGNDKAAEYLAKYGHLPAKETEWGISAELANAPAKKARKDSFTPFELLALASGEPEARAEAFAQAFRIEADQVTWLAADLWREYYDALQSRQMVVWGNGLLKLFRVEEQVAEQEAMEADQSEPVIWLRDYVQLRADVALYCEVLAAGADVERVVMLLRAAGLDFDLMDEEVSNDRG
jgi:hypothetical protein